MKACWNRFCQFPPFVQLIIVLCVVGFLTNSYLLGKDIFKGSSILWRLHLGFFLLYISQLGFIFWREKYVCFLTVLQGILALLTTADFIFVPILRMLGEIYFAVWFPSVEEMKVYKYIFISLAFTLQMYSAYRLFSFLNTSTEENVS